MNERLLLALSWLRAAMLRRGVALALLLGIAAAYASPVIQPSSIELLCSTNGAMKLISTADGEEAGNHSKHCSLCAPMAAPPPVELFLSFAKASACILPLAPFSAPLALTRPPLPARGPPSLS